jgi:hypothetical protein
VKLVGEEAHTCTRMSYLLFPHAISELLFLREIYSRTVCASHWVSTVNIQWHCSHHVLSTTVTLQLQ